MKTTNILTIASLMLLISLGILSYFGYQQMQNDNAELRNTLNIELRKALSQQKNDAPKDTAQDIAVLTQKLNLGILDSINSVIKKNSTKTQITSQANLQNLYKRISLITPGTSQQIKIDSLENKVKILSQLVKSNLANQSKPAIVEKTEKSKTLQTYYDDISIIFKTRNSYITGKVQPQYFSNLQYGQVFRFVNSIPDYMYSFTDKKGNNISNIAAKEFLSNKSFWLNSVELKEKKAVINCSIGI
jgi:hypothetical protein